MTVFANEAVAYFGETKKVIGIAPTEQVQLEIKETRMDYVFLMDDNTYTHFEFQTTNKGIMDLARFNLYDVQLYQRTKKQVYTYVIYSGDITNPLHGYANGFSEYKVKVICMADQDAEQVLDTIESKLKIGKALTNKEILDLIFTPIMGGKLTKEKKIVRALKISRDCPADKEENIQSMLYTFALKFLDSDQLEEVKEVLKMTKLGEMLKDEGRQEGRQEARINIARKLLKERLLTKEQIAENIGLSLETLQEIEEELSAIK